MSVAQIISTPSARGRYRRRVGFYTIPPLQASCKKNASWLVKYTNCNKHQGREVQAHLSALRALCWVLLEGMRTGLDPLPAAHSGTGGRGGWRETRARNRFRALQGRSAFIDDEERCVMCLVKVVWTLSLRCTTGLLVAACSLFVTTFFCFFTVPFSRYFFADLIRFLLNFFFRS